MEAKDLMIGDLVYNHRNWICLIVEIHKDSAVVIARHYGEEEFKLKDLRPVPLTPEILEKKGFKRDPIWHHCDKDLDDYSISIQLGYANRTEYIKIAEKGKDNVVPSERTKMYLTHVFYLHQLQHALRLCGIEKEIIL